MANTRKEMLPVALTPEEKARKADDQAAKVIELERMENAHKDAKKAMKEKEDLLKIKIRGLAKEVDSGEEDRLVDVHDTPSVGDRMVHTYRADTGDLVRSRPMTGSELAEAQQERIPGLM